MKIVHAKQRNKSPEINPKESKIHILYGKELKIASAKMFRQLKKTRHEMNVIKEKCDKESNSNFGIEKCNHQAEKFTRSIQE